MRLGIGRSFQTPTVFESLTVVENLDLAASFRRPLRRLLRRRRGISDGVAAHARAHRPARTWPTARPACSATARSSGWRSGCCSCRTEAAAARRAGRRHEPPERQDTGELLQELAGDHTVVVIEHDMAFLRRFASSVTVLHEGKILSEGSVDEVQADPQVREVYLGRSRDERSGAGRAAADAVA